jgi:hypothetical protein
MVAQTAHVLSTPVGQILEWDLTDLIMWHTEAAEIAKVRGL